MDSSPTSPFSFAADMSALGKPKRRSRTPLDFDLEIGFSVSKRQVLPPPPEPVPQWARPFARWITGFEPAELICVQRQLEGLLTLVQERRAELEDEPLEFESSSSSPPKDR